MKLFAFLCFIAGFVFLLGYDGHKYEVASAICFCTSLCIGLLCFLSPMAEPTFERRK